MPSQRGIEDTEEPDTVIPRLILEHRDGGYTEEEAITVLNGKEHESEKHYAAMVFIKKRNKYVLFLEMNLVHGTKTTYIFYVNLKKIHLMYLIQIRNYSQL